MRYAHADRVFSCTRSFTSERFHNYGREKVYKPRRRRDLNEDEVHLLAKDTDEERSDEEASLIMVLSNLNKSLSTMAASMATMERAMKRPAPNTMDTIILKKRKTGDKQGSPAKGDSPSDANSDTEILCTPKNPADSAIEGETGDPCARLEQDALLNEISQDFAQEEDVGPDVNQQLADIVKAMVLKPKRQQI